MPESLQTAPRRPRLEPPKPEKLLTPGQMAKRLAEPGLSADSSTAQIRLYQQHHWIQPTETKGIGRTAHRLYREDVWVTCKVLSVLADTGFADHSIMSAAARGLQEWPKGVAEHPARTPAQFVINEWGMGVDWWVFELGVHRHEKTGDRQVRARIRNADGRGTSYGLPDEYVEISLVTIDLGIILTKIFAPRTGMH
jgi:hypothetical protein